MALLGHLWSHRAGFQEAEDSYLRDNILNLLRGTTSCLLLLVSFFASHSAVVVKGTSWVKPVIVSLTVVMPSSSAKSSVFKYALDLVLST